MQYRLHSITKVSDLAIIILNWNGWRDTLECLTSLTESSYQHFQVIVVDNGSTDESLDKIRLWAKGEIPVSVGPFNHSPKIERRNLIEYDHSDIDGTNCSSSPMQDRNGDIILIKNSSNLGFAGGNNVGIRYTLRANYEKILLLNNDTTVDPNCLRLLSDFLDHNKTYDVVTPKICYYKHPNVIWNCGGKLTLFGSRKYYYEGINDSNIITGTRDITFVTGCALMTQASVFKRYGLLSERFFLGEEDYEFSLRMKGSKINMAAVEKAKVYHKVAASKGMVFKDNLLPSAFIFYLNRFVDLKDYYRKIIWEIWRLGSLAYIIPMLKIKHRIPFEKIFTFVVLLFRYSSHRNSVSKDDFFRAKCMFSDW